MSNMSPEFTDDELKTIHLALLAISPSGGGSKPDTLARKIQEYLQVEIDTDTVSAVSQIQISVYMEVCEAFEAKPHKEVIDFISQYLKPIRQ